MIAVTLLLSVEDLSVEFRTRPARCMRSITSSFDHRARARPLASSASAAPGKSVTALAIMGLLDRHRAGDIAAACCFGGHDLLRKAERRLR